MIHLLLLWKVTISQNLRNISIVTLASNNKFVLMIPHGQKQIRLINVFIRILLSSHFYIISLQSVFPIDNEYTDPLFLVATIPDQSQNRIQFLPL